MRQMFLNYLSPYVRYAADSTVIPPRKLSRVIFDYELAFIKSGNTKVTVGGITYQGKAGDIFLFRPHEHHILEAIGDTPIRQPHVHFDFFYRPDSPEVTVSFKPLDKMTPQEMKLFREDILEEFLLSFPHYIHLDNPSNFENILFQIIDAYNQKQPFYEMITKGLLLQLWAMILQKIDFKDNKTTLVIINRIKDYLDHNTSHNVSMEELSDVFHLSSIYISRIFKDAIGATPKRYHTMVRINMAKELIQYSKYSLTEIAYQLGFSSIHSFTRYFKKEEGVPPSFYRNT